MDLYYGAPFDPIRKGMDATNNPNEITVGGHGTPGAFLDKLGQPIPPEKMADDIRNLEKYKPGMPIRLYTCNGGQSSILPGSTPYADKIAKQFPGHTVYAASSYIWTNDGGVSGIYDLLNDDFDNPRPDKNRPGDCLEFCECQK